MVRMMRNGPSHMVRMMRTVNMMVRMNSYCKHDQEWTQYMMRTFTHG